MVDATITKLCVPKCLVAITVFCDACLQNGINAEIYWSGREKNKTDRGETVVILNFAVETPNFAVETPDFAVVPETPKIWQNQARIGKHHNHWF